MTPLSRNHYRMQCKHHGESFAGVGVFRHYHGACGRAVFQLPVDGLAMVDTDVFRCNHVSRGMCQSSVLRRLAVAHVRIAPFHCNSFIYKLAC